VPPPKDTGPSFLERHLKASRDEGAAALELQAYDTLRATAKLMRERAWELREGQRVFGPTRLSDHAIRRLEGQATELEKNVEMLLRILEKGRQMAANRKAEAEKRAIHRRYMKDWRQRKKIEIAEAKAREYESSKADES